MSLGAVALLGVLARRADGRLVYGAARNAAAGVRDHQARRLEEARTLHDLAALSGGEAAAPSRRRATR